MRVIVALVVFIGQASCLNLSTQLEKELTVLQNPAQCNGRMLLLHFTNMERDGLGSILHTVASAIAEGFHARRTVVLAPFDIVFTPGGTMCEERYGLECFVQPLGSCSFQDIPQAELEELYASGGHNLSQRLVWSDEARGNLAFYMPPLAYRQLPRPWWPSRLLHYVARLQPPLLRALHTLKGQLPWRRPVIGVHIRHGDSHVLHKPQLNFAVYIKALQQAVKAHKAKSVYVATDDKAVDEFAELWRRSQDDSKDAGGQEAIPLIVLDRIRVPSRGLEEFPYTHGGSRDYALEALQDLWLLSETDVFIGTLSSHFSAIPALLRYAKGMATTPTFLDISGVVNQSYQIGLLHVANLGRGPAADANVPHRWQKLSQRFLQFFPELIAHFEASFAMNSTDGLPSMSSQVFDLVRKSWQAGSALRPCPLLQPRHSSALLLHKGVELWNAGCSSAAQACWVEALGMAQPTHRTTALRHLQQARLFMEPSFGGRLHKGLTAQARHELEFWSSGRSASLVPALATCDEDPPASIAALSALGADLRESGELHAAHKCYQLAANVADGAHDHRSVAVTNLNVVQAELNSTRSR